MAAKNELKKVTLAKSIQIELTCAICLDRFKNPKLLPSLHSFCTEYLRELAAMSPKNGK